MFLDFFYELRSRGVPVTPLEWLSFMEALVMGLAFSDLVRMYHLARALCVKSETLYDAFDQAWLSVFKGIETPLDIREEIWSWLENPVLPAGLGEKDLERFRQAVDLEELRKQFEQRLKEQDERHDGGNKWIGTGGTSPFGHSGVHPGGLRVGGHGTGGMAAQIAARRAFRNYRSDRVLDTRQIGTALRKLRRFAREGARMEVDLDETIIQTARNAGDICVIEKPERVASVKLLLLMDAGGSMEPYARLVERLFSAASKASHFKDFKAYYFHNCVYEQVFEDMSRWKGVDVEQMLKTLDGSYRLVMVGDASMAPSELLSRYGAIDYYHRNEQPGIYRLEQLNDHFERTVWLNPMRLHLWRHPTVIRIAELFPMFELTLDGLEKAMEYLAGKKTLPPDVPEGPVRYWRTDRYY
ncbi:MAG: VWA domain-containing protein [Deltaproteobacteria bacterium]|nr:VWA domain-containing protein [Deltaproteobacteria bacterium]